jgi:hypothetical protein
VLESVDVDEHPVVLMNRLMLRDLAEVLNDAALSFVYEREARGH